MSAALDDPIQLRCRSSLKGILKTRADGTVVLEIRCKDKWCAERGAGVVVLHYFDVKSGALVETKKYRDPKKVPIQRKVK